MRNPILPRCSPDKAAEFDNAYAVRQCLPRTYMYSIHPVGINYLKKPPQQVSLQCRSVLKYLHPSLLCANRMLELSVRLLSQL